MVKDEEGEYQEDTGPERRERRKEFNTTTGELMLLDSPPNRDEQIQRTLEMVHPSLLQP